MLRTGDWAREWKVGTNTIYIYKEESVVQKRTGKVHEEHIWITVKVNCHMGKVT
jgi:hypothetical protein